MVNQINSSYVPLVSFRFPHLTEQLLLDSLPKSYEGLLRTELERRISASYKIAISRCSILSTDYSHRMEMIWQPEAVTSPSALASDGGQIIACGDNCGSITLLDVSSGKVIIAFCFLLILRAFIVEEKG